MPTEHNAKKHTPPGLRRPWEWLQPTTDADLVQRLIEARDYAVPECERENLCSVAAGRIGALIADRPAATTERRIRTASQPISTDVENGPGHPTIPHAERTAQHYADQARIAELEAALADACRNLRDLRLAIDAALSVSRRDRS